ncbi:hypothetical protein [Streptomyces globisporus]|uniref:hypothetical protein n=1 Tax=Streptomyces globisporus TaxID=1908 RepID=UPI0004C7F64F|nr:hypothetical protein [Streptomyces globisporus]
MHPFLAHAASLGVAGLLVATPLVGGSAVAASDKAPAHSAPVAAPATLSAKATARSIGRWRQFRIYGATTGLPAGTRVTLQQKQGGRWVNLPIVMKTNRKHAYNLRVMLGLKGKNAIRMTHGRTVSNTVEINIR